MKAVLETGIMKKIPKLFLEDDEMSVFEDNRPEIQALMFLNSLSFEIEGAQAITDKRTLSVLADFVNVAKFDVSEVSTTDTLIHC